MDINNAIKKAAEAISEADAILITAGAGIGVDSGLPDFRGNEGFWKAYPPIAKMKLDFSDMANPQWFKVDPELAWAFYGHRLNLYRQTIPHDGFSYLLEIANKKRDGYFVFTSNVDGQFHKANFAPERIYEVHGSINHLQCTIPCTDDIWSAESTLVSIDEEKFKAHNPLPKCRNCGAIARPNILMFGDYAWISDRSDEQSIRLREWLSGIDEKPESLAIIELGAGKMVSTVRSFSENVSWSHDATLIRINPRDYEVSDNNIGLPLGSLKALKEITSYLS